jgi:riboflavin biosynthesis pyrimidine reductase
MQIPDAATGPVENLVYGDQNPATYVYKQLEKCGYQRVLLFGGGVINRMFYDLGLVNELRLTVAPIFIGKASAPYLLAPDLKSSVRMRLLSCDVSSDSGFLFLRYGVK